MNTLKVQDISYAYGNKKILNEISFSLKSGENVYILGPNGVGKSTLFRCVLGHLKNHYGKVFINAHPIETYSAKELAKKIAYIPQSCNPTFNYTVLQLAMIARALVQKAKILIMDEPTTSLDYGNQIRIQTQMNWVF